MTARPPLSPPRLTPLRRVALAAALVAAAAPRPASARPDPAAALADPAARTGVEWRPVAVATAALAGGGPWTAAPSRPTARPVTVGPATAAVVRVAPLAALRVRALGPDAPQLRLWRRSTADRELPSDMPQATGPEAHVPEDLSPQTGPSDPHAPTTAASRTSNPSQAPSHTDLSSQAPPRRGQAAVAEVARELSPGTWLLEQPPGETSEWAITADRPTRLVVEAPAARRPELIWDHAAAAVLAWIDRGGPLPPLPEVPEAALLRRELLADAAIAAALHASDPDDAALARAARAWRAAAALQRITAARPAGRPAFAEEPRPRPLAGATELRDGRARWQRVAGLGAWALRATGPGMLWIDARHFGQDPKASLTVSAAGRRLARLDLRPAARGDPSDPLAAAGPSQHIAVPLAPGAHTYRLQFTGDAALLRVRVGRTHERLEAALRRERAVDHLRAAHRALAASHSPRAPLLDALLALVDGRPWSALPAPGGPPALALAHTWLAAQVEGLSPARRRALAVALADAADAVDDPALAGRARAAGLDLVLGTDDPALVRRLAGPDPAGAPPPIRERLAGLLDQPPHARASPAVALYDEARARAPHDGALRAAYRAHWREATRWTPLPADDGGARPLRWIEPLRPDPARPPNSMSLWTWPIGPARTFHAPTLPAAPERPALLQLYADLPRGAAGLDLAVDDRRWRVLPLRDREPLAVAVPPGEHTLAVAAPSGARVWSSLPPAPARAPDARDLRLWPLAPDQPLRFVLPGRPGAVRLELRALADDGPRRVHLTLRTDAGDLRELALDLAPTDARAVPLDDAPPLGPPATLVLPLDPQARSLELELPAGAPRLAVAVAIRAPGRDAPTRGGHVSPDMPQETAPAAGAPPCAGAGCAARDVHADALLTVERVSQRLREQPDDPALRLERAGALLDLGQRSLALIDWSRVVATAPSAALRGPAAAFSARLDELASPTHLDVAVDRPSLVTPPLAALDLDDADLADLAPLAALARARGPEAALQALDAADMSPRTALSPYAAETSPRPATRPPPAKHMSPRTSPVPRTAADAILSPRTAPSTLPAVPRTAAEAIAATPLSSGTSVPRTAADAIAILSPRTAAAAPPASAAPALAREALRAGLLDAAGRPGEAARAWLRVHAATGSWPVGLAGARSALAALDEPATSPAGAGLAYGLGLQLRGLVRTPALDRLMAIAGERSRWSRLILAERGFSRELRRLPHAPEPPTPRASVRAALLAPPWPLDGAAVLRPGAAATIELGRGGADLTFDLWCQIARPDLGDGDATLRFLAGDEPLLERPVPPDSPEQATVAVPYTDSVTVALDAGARGHLCAVRLRDAHARAAPTAARWHVARAAQPLEFAVLGPTALEIEALAADARARRLDVAIARGDAGAFAPLTALDLSSRPSSGPPHDPAAPADPRAPGLHDMPSGPSDSPEASAPARAARPLTLAEAGPLRVRLTPDAGVALVRVRQRLDDQPAPAPPHAPARPDPRAAAGADARAAPAGPPPRLPADPRPASRLGAPYAALHVGTDDLEEADDLRVRASGVVRLGLLRELAPGRVWLGVEPELRPREHTPLVAGGRLSLQTAFPRAGLRARLAGLGLVQTGAARPWSLRGDLRLDRPTWLAPRVQLLPGVELSARRQSLRDVPADARAELHPRVYQRYLDQHPLALRPTLDLRLVPWQDARAVVGVDVVTNRDVQSLDQLNLHVGVAAAPLLLGRVVPDLVLDYEASARLADADRARPYVRHRVLVGLGAAIWLGDRARLSLGARDSIYVSAPYGVRNGLDVWLRLDLTLGRGLRDQGPFDMSFRSAREHRLWR